MHVKCLPRECEDPIKDGLNWYAYCASNPVMFADPWGLYDVMISYIAGKNDGTAIYSESNFFGLGSWNQRVDVTINGVTKTYTIGEKDSVVRIVNGKSIIDHTILMSDFGLSESQATHQAGDKFDSEQHAVMAFGFMYHYRSLAEKQEYGASIIKDENGFSFVNVVWSFQEGNSQNDMSVNIRIVENMVGAIHTHWNPNGQLKFSPGDIKTAEVALETGYLFNWYLVNRNGRVYSMTLNKKQTAYNSSQKIFNIR